MKPLGTITIFFPHVDDETREILNTTMIEASDFNDFLERLGQRVIATDTPMLTQYIAIYFALWMENSILLMKIRESGNIPELAFPIGLLYGYLEGHVISWEEMVHSLKLAIDGAPNDWFVCNLYLMWSLLIAYLPVYPAGNYNLHPYESVIEDVMENEKLEYYRFFVLLIDAFKLVNEYEFAKAIELGEQALRIARKYDDQLATCSILQFLGQQAKHSNLEKAIDYVMQSKEISEILDNKAGLAMIQHILGHIMGIRGEYDAAIQHQMAYRDYIVNQQAATDFVDAIIAMYHNYASNGKDAYEFVKDIEIKNMPPRRSSHFHIQKTWATILLGRYDDAKSELELAHKLAIQSGETSFLLRVEMLEGLLDKCLGDLESAEAIFSKIYRSFSEEPVPFWENFCLLNLVEVEVMSISEDVLDSQADSSGQWMKTLQEHTLKSKLPGITAQLNLLKAKLREKQGRYEDTKLLIDQVLKSAESPTMRYLRNAITRAFPEMVIE